ncbi:unnamed protein product, partial [Mesorhabditis belari]|uniref:WD repeat-containing protein 44 n=1 Tax=Mesorhabditis belari TaxID=2138241 RepID=A0AAF3FN75_9BILA
MSDSDTDLFEDARTDVHNSPVFKEPKRPRAFPDPLLPAPSINTPTTSHTSQNNENLPTSQTNRRDRLRGLRKQMRDEFGGGTAGATFAGDGDTLSLISENTSLHSWHRKVLNGPSAIVHPSDSASTCAMSTRGSITMESPLLIQSPYYNGAARNSIPQYPSTSSSTVTSPNGPPPAHPPPPLPELRSPPPVPPRNPSICLPMPVPSPKTLTSPPLEPVLEVQSHSLSAENSDRSRATSLEKPLEPKLSICSISSMSGNSYASPNVSECSVQPTPASVGRRRGHTKTNSLDRGLTLAKSIKTGPFPPPSQKSNSLTRGTEPPDGEEEERNQEAEGVISELTTQLMSEHNSENTIASTNSSTDQVNGDGPSTSIIVLPPLEFETPIQKRLFNNNREARKSETIMEETESEASPAHNGKAMDFEKLSVVVEKPSPVQRSTSDMLPQRPSPSGSVQAVDPITRDVERRMSMKSHGQMGSKTIGLDDDERSDQLSPTSKMGYARSIVKSYASSWINGMINKAVHVWKPTPALKTDAEDSGSESEDGGDPSQADGHSSRGHTSVPLVRPKYSKKGPYDFENLKVAQEIKAEHTGAVWVVRFSVCGRLMATAGQDAIIRIWVAKAHVRHFEALRDRYMKRADCPPQEMFERSMCDSEAFRAPSSLEESDITNSNPSEEENKGPLVFMAQPFVTLKGHTADVLDLSWSKNNFVLSSGMDRTVKLWHITRTECLCCFQHVDFVTCVAFLPKDDRYFLSGSLDGKLRLWHIPDKRVAVWNEVQVKFITALAFAKNGKFAVVGTYNGRCYFYTADQLKYHTVVDARSTRGKNARGHKVTGLAVHGDKLLVTSNDSRVRMYDVRDMSLTCKFIGAQNEHSQIRASFAPDGKHVICGSEDKHVYLWRTSDLPSSLSVRKDRNKMWERVRAHTAAVSTAVFAPKPLDLLGIKSGHKPSSTSFDKDKQQLNDEDVIVSADLSGCIKVMICRTKPIQHASSSSFFNGSVLP